MTAPGIKVRTRLAVGVALLLSVHVAMAAAGKVLFVAGDVRVERGAPKALAQGDPVEVGDIVVTGAQSRAQLLMADGAKIALRSGSRFRIDAFALPASVSAPGQATATAKDGSSIATLLKGGFRTASGSIGKTDPAAYQVRTPVGVLGIRGTDYTAVFCAGDCSDAPGVATGEAIRDGLYLGVTTGKIAFQIAGGPEIFVEAGQFVFIPLRIPAPEQLPTEPKFLIGDGAGRLEISQLRGPAPEGATGVSDFGKRRGPPPAGPEQKPPQTDPSLQQPIQGTDAQGRPVDLTSGMPPPSNVADVAFSTANVGLAPIFTAVAVDQPAGYTQDGNLNLTAFTAPFPSGAANIPGSYAIGTASVAESGSDPTTQLRWGRWSAGQAGVTAGGAPQTIDLAGASLHWAYATGDPPVMPQTGNVTYSLVGNTSPTNRSTAVGTLGSATLTADFTNSTVASTLDLTVGGVQWTANGAGAIGAQAGVAAHQFGGAYNVTLSGGQVPTGTGSFSGFFSTPGGSQPGVPGGAGLTYSLTDDAGLDSVQGAAVFRSP